MRRELAISIAVGLAVLAVYGQTLGFEFVNWDDPAHVTHNPIVLRGLTPGGVAWALGERCRRRRRPEPARRSRAATRRDGR
jgi:hypothetical protein